MKKIFVLVIAIITISCDDFLEENPKSVIASSNFMGSDEEAISVINGAYGALRNEGVRMEFLFLNDVVTDDVVMRPGQPTDRVELDYLVYTSEHYYLYTVWENQYNAINRANTFLVNADPNQISEDLYNRLSAEARFLRAFFYFRLVKWFGDVPLILEPSTSISGEGLYPDRTPIAQIYEQIIEDLKFAESYLEDYYEYGTIDYYRATKASAKALLALVYMQMAGEPINDASMWPLVKEKCEEIITDRAVYGLELEENILDIFDVYQEDNNTEYIWGLPGDGDLSVDGWYYTRMATWFTVWKSMLPSKEVMGNARYDDISIWDDPMDDRRQVSLKIAVGNQGDTINVDERDVDVNIGKWYDETEGNYDDNDYPYIRYSEVKYALAESLIELNDLDGALDILNEFRERAGVEILSYSDKADLINKFRNEKRKEFLFEGKRRDDLVRWGIFEETMLAHGERQYAADGSANPLSHVSERNLIYPLPYVEYVANPNLRPQNYDY